MQVLIILIIIAAMLTTYAASYRVLRNHTKLEYARPVAATIALLSGLSLLMLGSEVVMLILLPYAVLGMCLLLLAVLKWFRHWDAADDPKDWLNPPPFPRHFDQDRQQPRPHRKSTSPHSQETSLPKE